MSRVVVSVCAALAATQLALGWQLGFHSVPAYLVSWSFFALAGVPAWRLTRFLFPSSAWCDLAIRAAVLVFAGIVLAGLALGGLRVIGVVPYLCLFGVGFALSGFLQLSDSPVVPPDRIPIAIAVVLLPLLAFIVAVGLFRSPLTLYDSLSYHLVFPARWLQDSALSIVQTPFSDPAQAYQPANGELFFLWLMLPFHGDLLARIGQLPFLLLAGLALYAMARRGGARPDQAAYAPVFFCLARPVVEQAVGADVDLICAAMFATSLYLGIVAMDTDRPRDWAVWGVSLGLYLGTKYLALVYVGILLLPPMLALRRKAFWALPGMALFALPWYARNWIIAGSPLYPASLKLVGVTVARGAFSREAMNNSVFHVTTLRLFPAIAAHAFGAALALVWGPAAILGMASVVSRRRWWPSGYVSVVPLLVCLLFWFGLPDNADSRFLLPGVAVAMVLPAWAFGSSRTWNACLHTVYAVAMVWVIVGMRRPIVASLPWFMGGWLTLDGIVARDWLVLFATGAAVAGCVCVIASRSRVPPGLWAAVAVSLGAIGLSLAWPAAIAEEASTPLVLSPIFVREGMIAGWEWVRGNIASAAIANTGNNVPYPLFGEHLSNRVSYVNIDRHGAWKFHDYARVRSTASPSAGALARPSGQLMPLLGPASAGASRPRFERWEGLQEAWIANLRAAGVSYLFASALSAYEIDYSWHDEGGFPIEAEWARRDPAVFRLIYENGQVRLYALSSP